MTQLIQKRIRKDGTEEGFTLIELLMVIIILAILAAVVIFSIQGINDRGQTSACKSDKRTVRTAQEAHFAKTNGYATSTGALATAGFLDEASVLHSTTATDSADTDPNLDQYTVTAIAPCT